MKIRVKIFLIIFTIFNFGLSLHVSAETLRNATNKRASFEGVFDITSHPRELNLHTWHENQNFVVMALPVVKKRTSISAITTVAAGWAEDRPIRAADFGPSGMFRSGSISFVRFVLWKADTFDPYLPRSYDQIFVAESGLRRPAVDVGTTMINNRRANFFERSWDASFTLEPGEQYLLGVTENSPAFWDTGLYEIYNAYVKRPASGTVGDSDNTLAWEYFQDFGLPRDYFVNFLAMPSGRFAAVSIETSAPAASSKLRN